jgi:SAM-dependent methyltransferase
MDGEKKEQEGTPDTKGPDQEKPTAQTEQKNAKPHDLTLPSHMPSSVPTQEPRTDGDKNQEQLTTQAPERSQTSWDSPGVAECIDKLWDRPDEEALRQKIADWIGYQQGRMVDVGCGTARIAAQLPASGPSYIGVDPSDEMLDLVSSPTQTQRASGDDLPFEDQSVPTVLCSQVFRHLTTYGPTLKEIARIAKRRVFLVDVFSIEPTETGKTEVCGQEFPDTIWSLDDVLADIGREFPGWSVEKRTFDVPFIVGLKLEAPKK